MKNLIISIVALLSFTFSYSQTVNGFAINEIPSDYIEVVGTSKILKLHQVLIYIDYGQISKVAEQKNGWVLGEDGKRMSFNGMMGAINFLSGNGWEYLDAYTVTSGNSNVYHYIMRKK